MAEADPQQRSRRAERARQQAGLGVALVVDAAFELERAALDDLARFREIGPIGDQLRYPTARCGERRRHDGLLRVCDAGNSTESHHQDGSDHLPAGSAYDVLHIQYSRCRAEVAHDTRLLSNRVKHSKMRPGICSSDATCTAPPRAIASFGIPNTTHDSSASAIVNAPAWRMETMPSAPSAPMPVRMSPTTATDCRRATEPNSTSTAGR